MRTLTPRLAAIVDRTPEPLREFHRHAAMTLAAADDWEGVAKILGPIVTGYWHEVYRQLAEAVAQDIETQETERP